MKFVFFGTPRLAVKALERLIEKGAIPVALVTNPDAPAGRKKILTPPPTKALIKELNLPVTVLQPAKIDDDFLEKLKEMNADIFVIVGYGKILPKALIDMPKYGSVNLHPSLLPKYRGATPVQTAILNGETETGVTLYRLDEKMDHGPIYMNTKVEIRPEDNTISLTDRLAVIGADMMVEKLFPFIGELSPLPQNEDKATYVRKFATSDGYIENSELEKAETENGGLAEVLDRKIRAMHPEPGCWTMKDNIRVKLLDSEIRNGLLHVKLIQKEGKKPTVN